MNRNTLSSFLDSVEVSPLVNSVKNNKPEVLDPLKG